MFRGIYSYSEGNYSGDTYSQRDVLRVNLETRDRGVLVRGRVDDVTRTVSRIRDGP